MSILYQLSANVAWYFLGPALIGVDQLVLVKVVFFYFFATDIAFNTIVIDVDPNVVLKILFREYFGTQIASDLRLSLPR